MTEAPQDRPDLVDLIGPEWDREAQFTAKQTLIICSSPRTGSYELCRFLAAAGIGVPHEYFHPYFAERLKSRWGLTYDPLSPAGLDSYVNLLRRRRAAGGIFSVKLQYWQFNTFLRNQHGASLFDGACVVHLFRPDIVNQLRSYRAARQTGLWDYSMRQTSELKAVEDESSLDSIARHIETLIEGDAGFRRLFALLSTDPLFVTMKELFGDPSSIVYSIARRLDATIVESELAKAIHTSSPYSHPPTIRDGDIARLSEQLKRYVFNL
jgi:LPS sulfotransferase NodH